MGEVSLTAGFAPGDEAQWRRLVDKVLAGRPFERVLVSRTRDGIAVEPLYPQRAAGSVVHRRDGRWAVFQRIDHPDFETANALARADVEGGADGLELVLPGAPGGFGYGVPIQSLADLETVLDGIDLSRIRLRLDGGYESRPAIVFLAALVGRLGIDPAAVDISVLSDPANGLLAMGRLTARTETVNARMIDIAHGLRDAGLAIAPLVADGRAVHAGGGSEAQELAYVLADGLNHLRVLDEGGIGLEDARRLVTFAFAADVDQFATIAKLRAFRLAWARIEEACGLTPRPARVHAETAWRMLTRRDPWVNILRNAVAAAAAGLGGADSVTVLPFTQALGLPDALARRIARNTQLVLIEESGLGRVDDPAAGSGYVEALTTALAEAAWAGFQQIEREGGIIESLKAGHFQRRVMATRDSRAADIATRREPITGVSEYPLLTEAEAATLKVAANGLQIMGEPIDLPAPAKGVRFAAMVRAVSEGATMADLMASADDAWLRTEPVPAMRLAEPFEQLRDRSDAALARDGRRPAVFLATLGQRSAFAARAGWTRNMFEAGGFEVAGADVYGDEPAAVAAFRASGARLACLCGADADYAAGAASLAQALRAAGAEAVYLAGRPGEHEAAWRAAGIDDFVFAGCDILSFLRRGQERLGLGGTDGRDGQ